MIKIATTVAGWIAKRLVGAAGPYLVLAIVGALAAAAVGGALYVASLHVAIATSKGETATQKGNWMECETRMSDHLLDDATALLTASREREKREAEDRARRAEIDLKAKEIRDALQHENDRLRSGLRAGTVRVRSEICAAAAPASGSSGMPGPGAAARAPGQEPASGADLLAESFSAVQQRDADYDELLAIAISDRLTCPKKRL